MANHGVAIEPNVVVVILLGVEKLERAILSALESLERRVAHLLRGRHDFLT